jgi:ankyrin repeat protein
VVLEGYAEAAGVPNTTAGELPIHLALCGGLGRPHPNTIFLKRLIDAYPSSTSVADLKNNLPLHLAAQYNAEKYNRYSAFGKVHPDSPRPYDAYLPSASVANDDDLTTFFYDNDVDVAYSDSDFVSDNSENDDFGYSEYTPKPNTPSHDDDDFRLKYANPDPLPHVDEVWDDFLHTLVHAYPAAVKADNARLKYANPDPLPHVDEAWDDFLHTLVHAYPAAVKAVNARGETPVHLAARNGISLPLKDHRKVLADAAAVADSNGNMLLHHAAWHGHRELVESLLEAYQPASNHPNIFEQLPLHCVVALGFRSCISSAMLLLEANPKAAAHQDHCGKLPIHYLCCEGPLSLIVAVLDAHPAGAAVADNAGMLPLNYAVQHRFRAVQDYLEQHRFEAEVVRKLLIANAEAAHIPDGDQGWLPIHHAVDMGNLCAVEELLAASPETALVREYHGWLPIHLAAAPGCATMSGPSFGDMVCLEDLLRAGKSSSQEDGFRIMQALIKAAPATHNAALPLEPLAPAAAVEARDWVLKRLPALARRQVSAEGADAASLAKVLHAPTALRQRSHNRKILFGRTNMDGEERQKMFDDLEDEERRELTLACETADAALATAEARAAHAAAVSPPPQASLEFSSLAGFTPLHLVCAACPAQQKPGIHDNTDGFSPDEVLAVQKLQLLLDPAEDGTQPPPSPSPPPVSTCGATPLHVAAHAGAVACIDYLLLRDGLQDLQYWDWGTPWSYVLKQQTDRGTPWRQALQQQTDRGHTALHLIARRKPPGHRAWGIWNILRVIDDVAVNGADIPDEYGCTPRQWYIEGW